jgi:hypothetical protein
MIMSKRIRLVGHVARKEDPRNVYTVWLESRNGRNTSEDLGLDGRIILKQIVLEGADWIPLAQDRELWRAVVNTAIKVLIP